MDTVDSCESTKPKLYGPESRTETRTETRTQNFKAAGGAD